MERSAGVLRRRRDLITMLVLVWTMMSLLQAQDAAAPAFDYDTFTDDTGRVLMTVMRQQSGQGDGEAATFISQEYLLELYQKLPAGKMNLPIGESFRGGAILTTSYEHWSRKSTVDGVHRGGKMRDRDVALHAIPPGYTCHGVDGRPKHGCGEGKTLQDAIKDALRYVAVTSIARVTSRTKIETTSRTVKDLLTGRKTSHRRKLVTSTLRINSTILIRGYKVVRTIAPRSERYKPASEGAPCTFEVPPGYFFVEVEVEAAIITFGEPTQDGPVPTPPHPNPTEGSDQSRRTASPPAQLSMSADCDPEAFKNLGDAKFLGKGLEGLPATFPLPPAFKSPERVSMNLGILYSIAVSGSLESVHGRYLELLAKADWRVTKTLDNVSRFGVAKTLFIADETHCGWMTLAKRKSDVLVSVMLVPAGH